MYNADLTTRITNFFYEETFTEGFISVLYNQGYLIGTFLESCYDHSPAKSSPTGRRIYFSTYWSWSVNDSRLLFPFFLTFQQLLQAFVFFTQGIRPPVTHNCTWISNGNNLSTSCQGWELGDRGKVLSGWWIIQNKSNLEYSQWYLLPQNSLTTQFGEGYYLLLAKE